VFHLLRNIGSSLFISLSFAMVVQFTGANYSRMMYSVFRLAARRTRLPVGTPLPVSAPVSEKRVELSRSPSRSAYGCFTGASRF
jgi:hypothetical protein